MTTQPPLVVIVGGGFGGLAAAKEMKCSCVNVLLIDRSNHHVFQPLLYQVATSVLAPSQIASPIRNLLANQANTSAMLAMRQELMQSRNTLSWTQMTRLD